MYYVNETIRVDQKTGEILDKKQLQEYKKVKTTINVVYTSQNKETIKTTKYIIEYEHSGQYRIIL